MAQLRWQDAERVLDVVVEGLSAGRRPQELCRQSYRLGYVAEKLGTSARRPCRAYRKAYELDATYLPALEGLGNLLVREQQWEEALRIFTTILIHHRDGAHRHGGGGDPLADRRDRRQAGPGRPRPERLQKALEIDGNHEPSRRSLVRMLEAAGDWEGAVENRQRLLPLIDGQAKFENLVAIGEACRDKLKDPYQAIDAFLARLAHRSHLAAA